jgi:acetate kinase
VRVLVVNAGSSSLKLSLLDEHDQLLHSASVPLHNERVDESALRAEVGRAEHIDAVGHRVVHGGSEFIEPVLIDQHVLQRLHALVDLAPLHQPKSLRALALISGILPDVPQVGCFDTAFHAHIPEAAATYALPMEWRTRWNLRRFGFHGLSHAYASRRAAELSGQSVETLRVVTCHLGAGGSLAAVSQGRSVDTTMGFTPLEGLVMATRSGSVDPGLMLWLTDHAGMPSSQLADTLEHRSGLLGLTGSAEMQAVLAAEEAGDSNAELGVAVYVHRLRAGIAAMASAMDGLDTLVFTGGVGENSPTIRDRAADGLGFLGITLEPDRNATAQLDAEIGSPDAPVRVFAIHAREDIEIARGVRRALAGGSGDAAAIADARTRAG